MLGCGLVATPLGSQSIMKKHNLIIFILFFLGNIYSQSLLLSQEEIYNTKLNPNSMYSYFGEGEFFSLRSCRIVWIKVEFDEIVLDKSDSTLLLKGRLYDDARLEKPPVTNFKIMIGTLLYDSTDIAINRMEVRTEYEFYEDNKFELKTKIKQTDTLCFTLLHFEQINNDGEKDQLIRVHSCEFFNIGRLL